MIEGKKIEIELSKSKLVKLLVFSMIFLAAGVWMILSDPETSNPVFNNPFVKTIAFYGATIMGLLGIYFFGRKLFDKKPGLIIDGNGIYDNTTVFRFGLIPWSDVLEIYDQSVQASIASKQYFVTIGVTNPDKYIAREKNLLKRKLLKANANSYGSPIHISTNGLRTNHHELLQLLAGEFAKYKHQH